MTFLKSFPRLTFFQHNSKCRNHLLLLLLLLCSLSVFADDKKNDWLQIEISGVNKALKNNIRAHLGAMPENAAQRRAFLFSTKEKIETALQSMGYYHGKMSPHLTRRDNKPWLLKIDINSGDPVMLNWVNIQVDGSLKYHSAFETWLNEVPMRPDEQLNQGQYEEVKSQLLNLALSQGYFDAKYVTSEILVNRDLNIANITLHLNGGNRYQFGSINFSGTELNQSLLDSLIPFPQGAFYATDKVAALNDNLLKTGYFSSIKVLPQIKQNKDNQVPVNVELSPKPRHTFDLGIGAEMGSTSDSQVEPKLSVKWRTPLINRWGHSQETSIEWSRDPLVRQSYRFQSTYKIPLSHPLDDQLHLSVAHIQDRYGIRQIFDDNDGVYYNDDQLESTESEFQIKRLQRLKNDWHIGYSLRYLIEYYEQSGIDYDPSYLIGGLGGQRTVKQEDSLDPAYGYRFTMSMQYADPVVGSAKRLIRFESEAIWVDTFFEKHRFVARGNLGAIVVNEQELELVPPSLRFFAGGDGSIRGYGYQELGPSLNSEVDGRKIREVIGGRYLAIASLEYQYYVTPSWRASMFVDAGNAFDTNDFDPVVAVGPGVAWISPVGPIKIDIGFGLDKDETFGRSWRIHLTMGSEL